jgi:hypothetical protein
MQDETALPSRDGEANLWCELIRLLAPAGGPERTPGIPENSSDLREPAACCRIGVRLGTVPGEQGACFSTGTVGRLS